MKWVNLCDGTPIRRSSQKHRAVLTGLAEKTIEQTAEKKLTKPAIEVPGARSKWNDNLWRGTCPSTANSKASRVLKELYYFSFLCVLCTADIDLHSSAEIEDIAARFGVGTPTLQHIIDGLKQPTDHDIRVSKYTLWNICVHTSHLANI